MAHMWSLILPAVNKILLIDKITHLKWWFDTKQNRLISIVNILLRELLNSPVCV